MAKDPKVGKIELERLLENQNYFCDVYKSDLWKETKRPKEDTFYYSFEPDKFVVIWFSSKITDFGMSSSEKLEDITYALRDGKTEYELFNKRQVELETERSKSKRKKKYDDLIANLERIKKMIPKYEAPIPARPRPFKEYLIDSGYSTKIEELKNRYIVIDVETNGTRKSADDLLSVAIYDPTTGLCYNRYLPLDLQPVVLTGFIHGIKSKDLSSSCHMNQEEIDWLLDYFDLKNKTVLSFSGGKGLFDSTFIINYCKRHGLSGFENLRYENIKSKFPKVPYGCEGQMTKDNLCRMLNITGVTELHSALNDCVLEWKLFEIMTQQCVFFVGDSLYKYTPGYIIPFSYLTNHKELLRFSGVSLPFFKSKASEIYKYSFPKSVLKEVQKFPTNITGIALESGINNLIKAEKQDNSEFLIRNKRLLEYIGTLDSRIKTIPVLPADGGMIKAVNKEDEPYINQINNTTEEIMKCIRSVVDFIKESIFKSGTIKSQEMVVSEDNKILALCDLSDEKNVLEIKTYDFLRNDMSVDMQLCRQLYYQSKGRKTYALSIVFKTFFDFRRSKLIVDGLDVSIYKIDLEQYDPTKELYQYTLTEFDKKILCAIVDDLNISKKKLVENVDSVSSVVEKELTKLIEYGYLTKEDFESRKSPWIVLRKPDDCITKLSFDGEQYHPLKD